MTTEKFNNAINGISPELIEEAAKDNIELHNEQYYTSGEGTISLDSLKQYLLNIKELQEAKKMYENTIDAINNQISKLAIPCTYPDPPKYKHFSYYLCKYFKIIFFIAWFGAIIECPIIEYLIMPIVLHIKGIEYNDGNIHQFFRYGIIPLVFIYSIILILISYRKYTNGKILTAKSIKMVKEQRTKDQLRVDEEKKVALELIEKKNYYLDLRKSVEKKLKEIYDYGKDKDEYRIEKRYQCYNASILFYEYLQDGTCTELRQCKYRFILDEKFAYTNYRISLLEVRFEQLKEKTYALLEMLSERMEYNIRRTNQLIEDSYTSNIKELNSLKTNLFVNDLLMIDYIEHH